MIKTSFSNGLQLLKFSNPRVKNALARDDYAQLGELLRKAATDDAVKVTVLTGEGDFYSSGNNLKAAANRTDAEVIEGLTVLKGMLNELIDFPKLLIGLVNGPCIGIGATSVAHCDVIYAAESAYFYTPFTKLALNAEGCASYTFPRILGRSKANEMLLLNHKMTAQEAKKYNFVSRVYKESELPEIMKQIEGYAQLPVGSIIASKKLIRRFDQKEMKIAAELEIEALLLRYKTGEASNAVENFKNRKTKT